MHQKLKTYLLHSVTLWTLSFEDLGSLSCISCWYISHYVPEATSYTSQSFVTNWTCILYLFKSSVNAWSFRLNTIMIELFTYLIFWRQYWCTLLGQVTARFTDGILTWILKTIIKCMKTIKETMMKLPTDKKVKQASLKPRQFYLYHRNSLLWMTMYRSHRHNLDNAEQRSVFLRISN